MIALEISLLMKDLQLDRIYCVLETFLSKHFVQIFENVSSLFSFRNCPLSLSLFSLRKFRYQSPQISNN